MLILSQARVEEVPDEVRVLDLMIGWNWNTIIEVEALDRLDSPPRELMCALIDALSTRLQRLLSVMGYAGTLDLRHETSMQSLNLSILNDRYEVFPHGRSLIAD
jgi:hypothetical protein